MCSVLINIIGPCAEEEEVREGVEVTIAAYVGVADIERAVGSAATAPSVQFRPPVG